MFPSLFPFFTVSESKLKDNRDLGDEEEGSVEVVTEVVIEIQHL